MNFAEILVAVERCGSGIEAMPRLGANFGILQEKRRRKSSNEKAAQISERLSSFQMFRTNDLHHINFAPASCRKSLF